MRLQIWCIVVEWSYECCSYIGAWIVIYHHFYLILLLNCLTDKRHLNIHILTYIHIHVQKESNIPWCKKKNIYMYAHMIYLEKLKMETKGWPRTIDFFLLFVFIYLNNLVVFGNIEWLQTCHPPASSSQVWSYKKHLMLSSIRSI